MSGKNKQRLFEVMERLNPEFKVSEVIAPQPAQTATAPATGDVANLQKAANNSPTIQYADSKIDTPQELQAAFGDWLSRTGYGKSQKVPRNITISQVQTLVKNAMIALGYK